MKLFKRAMVALALGAAASTLVVTPAHAAGTKVSSVVKYCRDFAHDGYGNPVSYSDYNAKCAQVYTTTNLTVRTGPSTAYASHGSLQAGRVYEFDCWKYGQTVDGNNVWLNLYSAAGGPYYVSDRYVYTGPNVKTILWQC